MGKPGPSLMQLYGLVTAAYQQAGFLPLFSYVLKNLNFWSKCFLVSWLPIWICLLLIGYFPVMQPPDKHYEIVNLIFIFFSFIIVERCVQAQIFEKVFKKYDSEYQGLSKLFQTDREFHRYILFRNALNTLKK